ncbi:hypothetical protein ACQ4N7_00545 [Nodosilinea sp. AN01ver1]|uniref:hypothetical protein n=1 Tax=Nodosilinea sp. AN01ver1 TaxID=3423362 RepID=UPI003D31C046
MNEYVFSLPINLGLSSSPGQSPTHLQIAKLSTDPHLAERDKVHLYWEIGLYDVDAPVNCIASVVRIINQVIPAKVQGEEDLFKKIFCLDIPDKEDFPRIREILIRFNGEKLVLPPLSEIEADT